MQVEQTGFKGLMIIKPKVFEDNRGYFFESYSKEKFLEATGLDIDFVQDNQSFSYRGVLRGFHFQKEPFAQSKLVRVLHGRVLDVVVDIRKNSPTFGKTFAIELSDKNQYQLFVPKGFGHAFITLSETAQFAYKVDEYYHPEADSGINYADEELSVNWQMDRSLIRISPKDAKLLSFTELKNSL
jgi:dTDP-4-dehydrorhamnose 3,5-epimerase